MIYGECPFQSNNIAKLIQILQTEELRLPYPVPEPIETLIRRMLVKDPARRIDWADLFEYEISETGEITEPKHVSNNPSQIRSIRNLVPTQQFNPSQSMGGAGSSITPISIRQPPSNSMTIKQDSSFNDASSYRANYNDHRNNPPIKRNSILIQKSKSADRYRQDCTTTRRTTVLSKATNQSARFGRESLSIVNSSRNIRN